MCSSDLRARLAPRRRLDPHAVAAAAVVIVGVRVGREHLVLHAERRLAVRAHLVRLRERETDASQSDERARLRSGHGGHST